MYVQIVWSAPVVSVQQHFYVMFRKQSVLEVPRPRRRATSSKGQIASRKFVGLKLDRYLLITYRLPKKLRKVNVCSRVCLSVCMLMLGGWPMWPQPGHVKTCSLGGGPLLFTRRTHHTGCFGPRIHILIVHAVNLRFYVVRSLYVFQNSCVSIFVWHQKPCTTEWH